MESTVKSRDLSDFGRIEMIGKLSWSGKSQIGGVGNRTRNHDIAYC